MSHVHEIILPKNMFGCPLKLILGVFAFLTINQQCWIILSKWFKVLWKHDMMDFIRCLTIYVGNNIWDKYSCCWTWINFGFFAFHFCVQLIYLISFYCKSCFDNESFVYIFHSCGFCHWKQLYHWIDFEIPNDTPFST
jgi:hypothetical protein